MNGQVTALVDSEEMENGKRIYRTQYLRRDYAEDNLERMQDKELRVSRQYKPVNHPAVGRKFPIQRDAMRIAKLTGRVDEATLSDDGNTLDLDDQDSPILRKQRKRQLDASRPNPYNAHNTRNTKVSGLGSPRAHYEARPRTLAATEPDNAPRGKLRTTRDEPKGYGHQEQGSYQALELDYMLIRKALKALEERVKLQEELRNDDLEAEERAAKQAILDKSRQEWTEKVEKPESGNPDEDAHRKRLETSLQVVKSQMHDLEGRVEQTKALNRLRQSAGFQIAARLVMVVVGAILLVQLFRAVTIQYNAEEQDLRRRLGPGLYRDGWLEYSMLIF